jgi:hypothetical protein
MPGQGHPGEARRGTLVGMVVMGSAADIYLQETTISSVALSILLMNLK